MIPAVQQLRDDWGAILKRLRQPDSDFHPACDNCKIDACCYEPVFSDKAEVTDILSRLSSEQFAKLKGDVLDWYHRAKPFFQREKEGIAFDYLAARIPCPFLAGGRCGIYEHRPIACRTHYALSDPEQCEMPARRKQKYAMWEHSPVFQQMVVRYMIAVGDVHLDHFGLLLFNALFGFDEKSKAVETFRVEEITNTQQTYENQKV